MSEREGVGGGGPVEDEAGGAVWDLAKLFGIGLTSGVVTLFALAPLSMSRCCRGATSSERLERDLRRECLARNLSPEELLAARATRDAVTTIRRASALEWTP